MAEEAFDEPELAGYVPIEGTPRQRRRRRVARGVILVGLGALVLPTVVGTWALARSNAIGSCGDLDRMQNRATATQARFDLLGEAGPGWYCVDAVTGHEVAGVGLIPYAGIAGAGSS